MKHISKGISLATLAILGATALVHAPEAQAQRSKGRRNTTIALGAVTAYGLLKGNKKVAIVGGLGTAYAYKRYRDSGKNRRVRNSARYDSRGNRYAAGSRRAAGRTYYDRNGRVLGRN